MNDRNEAREYAAVMTAYADGMAIQYRSRFRAPGREVEGRWSDHPECPAWDWGNFEYRVKPEPMEIEVWFMDGKLHGLSGPDLNFPSEAWTKRKFREVIE